MRREWRNGKSVEIDDDGDEVDKRGKKKVQKFQHSTETLSQEEVKKKVEEAKERLKKLTELEKDDDKNNVYRIEGSKRVVNSKKYDNPERKAEMVKLHSFIKKHEGK
jgi:hypothetical protein